MKTNRRDMAMAIRAINLATEKGFNPYDNHAVIAKKYADLWRLEMSNRARREAASKAAQEE